MEFEWDERKSRSNDEQHHVQFDAVLWVFDGRLQLTRPARQPDRERFATTAESDGIYFTVVWERWGATILLMSARRASNEEKRNHRGLYG